MASRKWMLVVCVAASCAGCVTETKTVPMSTQRAATIPDLKPVEPTKRDPQPMTLVAAAKVQESVAEDPRTPQLQKNDCRDEARRDYTRALEMDPKCLDAYTGLAGLYAKSQDFERAIATYQRGIKQIPNSPLLWYEEGIVACQRKDFPDALKCLGKAHQLDPENHLFGAQYGLLLARTGQPQEAVTVLSRVMNKAEANYNVARMMDHMNDSEKARQYCTVALQERPTHEGAIHLQSKLDGPRGGTLGAPEWEGQGDSDVRPASWTTSQ